MARSRTETDRQYRAKYPEKRAAERQKNYASTGGPEKNRNHRARWALWEIKFLEGWNYTDRELHFFLGRSVQAIQNMRHKLKEV